MGEDLNIWAILMPAVYQLVPGSVIAKLWFSTIFAEETSQTFSNLMVISTSLALGLIVGFAIAQTFTWATGVITRCAEREDQDQANMRLQRQKLMEGMYTVGTNPDDDPASNRHVVCQESKCG